MLSSFFGSKQPTSAEIEKKREEISTKRQKLEEELQNMGERLVELDAERQDAFEAAMAAALMRQSAAGVAGQDYLRPAAVKAGVIPPGYHGRFGWHNLRHSLATFFAGNEVNLPVIQSMMRHAKPTTTARYMHRVNSAQMAAGEKFLDAIKLTAREEVEV